MLRIRVDPNDPTFVTNRDAMLSALTEIDAMYGVLATGGGSSDVVKNAAIATRHRRRGKLLPHEHNALILEQDAPFLDLSPLAGWGIDDAIGAGLVTALSEQIGAGGPEAVANTKELLRRVPTMTLAESFAWTAEKSTKLYSSEEAREGTAAFHQDRAPSWLLDREVSAPIDVDSVDSGDAHMAEFL